MGSAEAVRIAMVDDHELVGFAVRSIADDLPWMEFTRHVATVAALVDRGRDADVVVLDLNLRDGTTPAENVAAIRDWGAEVLVLTSAEDPYLVREASRTAALGIVRKSAPLASLREALIAVSRGEPALSTEWASALDTDPLLDAAPLTDREREVLSLYASGLGVKQVATQLYVSDNTIDDHLRRIRHIYQQIGRPAATKVELYQRGIEDGYLPAPGRG
ncbi:response regulator transcription factor [Microbacterium sp. X-17]|uniref:response regulator transcription factor n=1 Tax=Microbacterium sp. X-17 TaxID=3144404 RepID=UPI0031F55B04